MRTTGFLLVVINVLLAIILAIVLFGLIRIDTPTRTVEDPRPPSEKREMIESARRESVPVAENEVVAGLLANPEIIPFDPVLGGTMGFYDPGNITVLNDRWVYAVFEDGHVAGSMLIEYVGTADGIVWSVIDAALDE
ncbi:MAG: hypothetical protein EA426_19575 [Spirochaetaceae bacterium]|nr:MAG: hypothetical protein EA426_19575 [Spirochaetaceae bacterium]